MLFKVKPTNEWAISMIMSNKLKIKPYIRWTFIKILLCLATIFSLNSQAKEEKIPVIITADAGYPPYSFIEKGKPTGIYYKILQKIFENIDPIYEIDIRPLPWAEAVDEVKNGEAFAVYPPYKITESRPWMSYSDPILQETISVFCHEPIKKWPTDYTNSKVGINYGFAFPPSVFKLFRDNKMQIFALNNNEAALKFFQKKKIDCYVNDRDAVLYTNNNLHFAPIKEVSALVEENSYLGFSSQFNSKYKFKDDFLQKFNANLQKIKKDGTLDHIVNDFLKKN